MEQPNAATSDLKKLQIDVTLDKQGQVVHSNVSVKAEPRAGEVPTTTVVTNTIATQTDKPEFDPHDTSLTKQELIAKAFAILRDYDDDVEEEKPQFAKVPLYAFMVPPPIIADPSIFDERFRNPNRYYFDGPVSAPLMFKKSANLLDGIVDHH